MTARASLAMERCERYDEPGVQEWGCCLFVSMIRKTEQEIARLSALHERESKPTDSLILRITGSCPGNAAEIADRVRSVLVTVLVNLESSCPSTDEWEKRIPGWLRDSFIDKSTHEKNVSRTKAWLSRTLEERIASSDRSEDSNKDQWFLPNWIYWFEAENRLWEFWQCYAPNPFEVRLEVLIDEIPVAHSALDWLISVAGARDIEAEEIFN